MSKCTDCLIDLTDACPRGSGRAIDDEICDSFIQKETNRLEHKNCNKCNVIAVKE